MRVISSENLKWKTSMYQPGFLWILRKITVKTCVRSKGTKTIGYFAKGRCPRLPLSGELLNSSLFVRRPAVHHFTSTSCGHKSGLRMEGDPCSFAASRCRCRRPNLPMSHSLIFQVSCIWIPRTVQVWWCGYGSPVRLSVQSGRGRWTDGRRWNGIGTIEERCTE